MVLKLDTVIPYGRSMDEYKTMFALSDADLQRQIVGIGDGPASFNAALFAVGKKMVSVDPLSRIIHKKGRTLFNLLI